MADEGPPFCGSGFDQWEWVRARLSGYSRMPCGEEGLMDLLENN